MEMMTVALGWVVAVEITAIANCSLMACIIQPLSTVIATALPSSLAYLFLSGVLSWALLFAEIQGRKGAVNSCASAIVVPYRTMFSVPNVQVNLNEICAQGEVQIPI
ncbi:unnamed protein product [Urochloa humidicola]